MEKAAALTVLFSGIWLIALGVAAFVKPEIVKILFDKFASSAFAHFLEMFVRLVVGSAFVINAAQMKFPVVFTAFGWLMIATTMVLVFVPWRIHRRFADGALPVMYKWMTVFGVVSLLGGVFVLYSVLTGSSYEA